MALPHELTPFTVNLGDFLYKTAANQAEWTRLRSPKGDPRHNCHSITFDSGVTLTQTQQEHRSLCKVKLILKPPLVKFEDAQLIVEAECVEIGNPVFHAYGIAQDRPTAVEHAKTMPLAQLDKNITAVKLRNFNFVKNNLIQIVIRDDYKLSKRISALIECGYRAVGATQPNGSAGPAPTTNLGTAEPGPSSGSPGAEVPAPRPTLEEQQDAHHVATAEGEVQSGQGSEEYRPPVLWISSSLEDQLRAHHVAAAEGERWLRHEFEHNRQVMLWSVAVTINMECDRQVEVAVARYQAKTRAVTEHILANGRG